MILVLQSFEIRIKSMFERMEYILETLNDLVDRAIERYPENQSFQNWKSRILIPDQFELAAEHHHDEDAVISTPAFGQDGEEKRDDDDDDEDDGNNNQGNDDDGNDDDHDDDGNDGDAGMAVGGNDENDLNEDEDVGGNGANEEELTDLNNVVDNVVESAFGSQFAIQVTQVESLNVQSSAGIIFYIYISIKFI